MKPQLVISNESVLLILTFWELSWELRYAIFVSIIIFAPIFCFKLLCDAYE